MSFYVHNRSSRPKIDPHANFRKSQAEEIFSFSKFLGLLDEKRAAATDQGIVNFAITKSHQVFLIGSCEFGHPGF